MTRGLTLLIALALPVLAADPKTVEGVKAAERAWATATVKGDAATLNKLYTDDVSYTHSTGDTDTKKVFIDNLKGGRKYHKIDYESLDARLYLNGTAAVVMAVAKVETSMKGAAPTPAHLRFVHFWIYEGGQWKLAAHQSLRLPN